MNYKEYTVEQFLQDQYFTNWVLKPSSESDKFWKDWVRQNQDKIPQIELAREIILSARYKNQHVLSEANSSIILENIMRAQANQGNDSIKEGFALRQFLRVAAVIALAASVVVYFLVPNRETSTEVAEVVPSAVVKTAELGQKRTIGLPDGTIVKLNAGSSLSYLQPFEGQERRVQLDGEAFFEVTKDANRPFIIEAGGLITKVLGTSFNISSYDDAASVKVSVLSGVVQVESSRGQKEVLYPDMMGVLYKDTENLNKTTFNEKEEFGWKDGIIYFKNNPLKEVFRRLEKWYGVDIKLDSDQILQGTYTGEFKNASLEKVLEGICYTSQLTYSVENEKITIKLQTK
jgi:transmembrane sensor